MKLNLRPEVRTGYMLVEALVYIGVSFLLLGVGFAAMYRCIYNSVGLRRSADDITSALHAGERWRKDVRGTVRPIQLEKFATEQVANRLSWSRSSSRHGDEREQRSNTAGLGPGFKVEFPAPGNETLALIGLDG